MEEMKTNKKNIKKSKIDIILDKLVIFFGVIFIIAGGITIGQTLADQNNSCYCPKEKKEEVETASKEKYEFDYNDGLTPGTNYKGYIDFKTGEAKIEATAGCSTLNCEIPQPNVYEGTFDVATLNKIIKYLEKNNYPSTTEEVNKTLDLRNSQVKFINTIINILEYSSYSSQLDELIA